MSRRRNFNEPGHAHELTFSCYQRHPFLKAERTCVWLEESINAARQKWGFNLWAYVFMPEHVHLIVAPRRADYDISQIRRAIKEPVARRVIEFLETESPEWIPRITARKGNLPRRYFWQPGGGYDRNIVEPRTLMQMVDYIHHNPVRRGLVERARDWKWSSACWYEDKGSTPIVLDRIPLEWMP